MAKQRKMTFANVTFKGMTANHEKSRCSIGLFIETDGSLDDLDALFTGGRLSVKLTARPKSDIDDESGSQQVMKGVNGPMTVEGIADCKGFTRRPEKVGISLVFNDENVPAETLAPLTGKSGKLKVLRVGDCGSEEDE